jgi:hypothetical protein
MLEAVLQKQILAALNARGVFCWRANTGAARTANSLIRFGLRGQADILGVVPPTGRLIAVECKSPTGRVSPEQRAFGERVTAAGGVYVVARCLVDVLAVLP